jgi:hypothetical protein
LNIEAALRIIDDQRQALKEALRAQPNPQIKLEILRAISANQDRPHPGRTHELHVVPGQH